MIFCIYRSGDFSEGHRSAVEILRMYQLQVDKASETSHKPESRWDELYGRQTARKLGGIVDTLAGNRVVLDYGDVWYTLSPLNCYHAVITLHPHQVTFIFILWIVIKYLKGPPISLSWV